MKEKKSKIKVAVIGHGNIGKRHADLLMINPETELVAICDTRPPEMLQIGNSEIPFYHSLETLLREVDFDVLSIATPNGLHAPHALMALNAKKHVIIEKPMALSKADCEKIIYKALQVDKQVFCVMQNRYSPPSYWMKELIESGKMGKIYMVQLNCFWNRDERYYKKGGWKGTKDLDGGPLFTQFSHFIDAMYWLFDDITDIKATFRNFNHRHSTDFEDSGIVNFKFIKGGFGSLNYSNSVWDKNMESSVTVIAENGAVKIAGQYMNEVVYCHVRDYVMPVLPPSNPPNNYGHYTGSAANHNYVFDNVVGVLKGRNSIHTNALEGFKVVDIIERIYSLKRDPKPFLMPENKTFWEQEYLNAEVS
jgi:predicted dehydrogenase